MIRKLRAPQLATAVCIALLLHACGSAPQKTEESAAQQVLPAEQIETLLAEGRALAAVRLYTDQARAAREPLKRQGYLLSAIEVLFDHGYPELGIDRLKNLPKDIADPTLAQRRQLVEAQAAVAQNQPENALAILDANPEPVYSAQQRRALETRAQAHAQLGDTVEMLRARIALDRLLETGTPPQERNRVEIWRTLEELDDPALAGVSVAGGDADYRGWIELAYTMRDAQRRGGNLGELLGRWRQRFPGHPADGSFSEQLIADITAGSGHPNQIALLLPLSGRLANAAAAVRDGFLAAWYNDNREGLKPDIRVYDTGDGSEGIWGVYNRAMADGAGYIIGPLRKEAVEELAQTSLLPLPVLALNYAETPYLVPPENFTQFGLLPEDEARTVAEFVAQNDLLNAVAMVPEGRWGQRMATAFSEAMSLQGGQVLGIQTYKGDAHDFADPIRNLMHLTESRQRNALLQRVLGQKIEFEPRRRQDVDLIFLAAAPRQGRLIKPQFKFHHAGDIPVYSTSRIFSGTVSSRDDRDLDGLRFSEIPWLLQQNGEGSDLAAQTQAAWQQASGGLSRLYALGADAYALAPWLPELRRDPGLRLNGQTGQLTMGPDGRISRKLSWAEFQRGRPEALLRGEE